MISFPVWDGLARATQPRYRREPVPAENSPRLPFAAKRSPPDQRDESPAYAVGRGGRLSAPTACSRRPGLGQGASR
jgi:hypothetical protein